MTSTTTVGSASLSPPRKITRLGSPSTSGECKLWKLPTSLAVGHTAAGMKRRSSLFAQHKSLGLHPHPLNEIAPVTA
jgi:hypothetical protein